MSWCLRAVRAVALYFASLHRAGAMRRLVAFGVTITDVGAALPLLAAIVPGAMRLAWLRQAVWAVAAL
ncbi:hypothetical protein [Sphingobium aromaticiconvertens]|uniref:hypothetical protein n=1 Tax=Sphingobium aromaticiconvertens TaxID=365341 RepID=UPI003019FAF0